MKLTIASVYYNSTSIEATAESVFAGKLPFDFEYFIINNASERLDALDKTCARFPAIRRIDNPDNRGFAVANNQAIAQSKGEYFFFLNPDIILQPNTIAELVQFMEREPQVGCCSCRLLDADGELLASCRRYPTWPTMVSRFVRWFPNAAEHIARYEMRDVDHQQVLDVDWLSGGLLLARTAILRQLGGLDERYFLYFEDVDICRQIKQRHRVVYYPKVECHHLTKHSSRKKPRLFLLHIQACLKYFRKWGLAA